MSRFSRGVKDENTAHLRLAVKQYVPKNQKNLPSNAITFIMAHGVGSSKESYEPLYDELLHYNLPIRAVWAMDIAHHGESYVMNEDALGDSPHWFDSSRDMFQMINYFQNQMPPPLVGIGQSWGGVYLSMLAVWHPRLFSAIVSMEPVFGQTYSPDIEEKAQTQTGVRRAAKQMTNRKDTWPSRKAAWEHLSKNPYYGAFDPRVFNNVIEHDLRDIPSKNPANGSSPAAVTLKTPKTMEIYTILRPDPPFPGFPSPPDHKTKTPSDTIIPGFFRGERAYFTRHLQYLLPSVLLLWGTLSGYANTSTSRFILNVIGTGLGGNGGVAAGKVTEALVEGAHHPIPLEKPAAAAKVIASWLRKQIRSWDEEAERRSREPPFADKEFHPEWIERIAKL